jgi:flagellar motor switch protein FliM
MSAAPRELFVSDPEGPGARGRAQMDRSAPRLAAAFRRAIPFMVRRGLAVTPEPASSSSFEELETEVGSPRHVVHLQTAPGDRRGALVFDAAALGFVFDGALGGDASVPSESPTEDLSGPQRAVITRSVNTCVPALSDVLCAAFGIRLRMVAAPDDARSGDEHVTLRLRLGPDGTGGSVVLMLDHAAFSAAPTEPERDGAPDPAILAALGQVPLELVAELGHVRMTLRELVGLRVGHAITVPVPIDGTVPVRVAGRLLFEGYPTTSGARIAIRVVNGVSGTVLDGTLADAAARKANP